MPIVIGIRFKDSGKTYFFDPRDMPLAVGEQVIVETARGPELAKVAYERTEVPESELVGELKPVLRRAEASDYERMRLLHQRHDEVLARCAEKIAQHSLPMSLVKAEYSFDGSRLTFYFTAEKRVDFRMLVRDLARTFKSRIELRQIGPRDEAKLLGGIGPCGRLLCCATFLPDYARVSIKMAKDQDLPLNPSKISGVCGRLLCCLSYEHEQYLDVKAELPRRGEWVQTPDGPGEVTTLNVIRESVLVAVVGNEIPAEYTAAQIRQATAAVGGVARARAAEGITPRPEPRPRREPRDRGERRLLRDEVEQGDVLDALAMLEDDDLAPPTDPSHNGDAAPPPPGRQADAPHAPGQRRPNDRPPQQRHDDRSRPPQRDARPQQNRDDPDARQSQRDAPRAPNGEAAPRRPDDHLRRRRRPNAPDREGQE
jgi:cell fate regulator YaaT (PSP1 superfamily)